MLIILTDGVGLTNKLASDPKNERTILKDFYATQIEAFGDLKCPHLRIVKTTGDGLIITTSGVCKNACGVDSVCDRMLVGISRTRQLLWERQRVFLRSVMHFCDDKSVVKGRSVFPKSESPFNQGLSTKKYTREALSGDIFGLEVIRVARIAALVKDDFHIITEDFLRELLSEKTNDLDQMRLAIDRWNQEHKTLAAISPFRVPVPYLKGFEESGMGEQQITIKRPYYVWEVAFAETDVNRPN